jgi:PAS domain S-box-containing protein
MKSFSEKDIIKVLIAEDDLIEQRIITEFFKKKKLPYDLVLVESVKDAVRYIDKGDIDVIISDYYLADGTALEIIEKEIDIPIIVMTSSEEGNIAVLSMKAGAMDYIIKTGDITHLEVLPITIEKAVKLSNDKNKLVLYSKAIMHIRESIYFTNMDNVIIFVNKALINTFGYFEEELIGRDPALFFKSVDPNSCLISGEMLNVKKNGEVFPVYMLRTPILNKFGNTVAACVIVADITQRKKAEEEHRGYSEHLEKVIEERTKRLREVERLATIGETAAMVGHDLRNPLQVLINNIYMAKLKLKKIVPGDEQSIELARESLDNSLDVLEEQTIYMNKIVSDLQDYAKNMPVDAKPSDVNMLIGSITGSIMNSASVEIKTNFEKDFPHLSLDERLMQRVFTNLIINGIQASNGDGIININGKRVNGEAVITIDDNGSGIDKDALDKIFKPLFTTKSKGVGLGLSVCKKIIEAHGGNIKIENKLTKGAIVTLTFPIQKGETLDRKENIIN